MSRGKKLAELGVLVALAMLLGLVWQKGQAIEDWVKLRGYQSPPAIQKLATEDTMTATARHLFYLNRPQLVSDKTSFRRQCPVGEQTIVVGCYRGGESGISIYAVQDKRLAGIEQVTAAHEMLHAAYDRLDAKTKKSIDTQLVDFYNHGLTDKRIKSTVDSYRQTEPHDVVNEMHSVFGTEVAKLPAGLESYYQRYFSDRSKVTGYAHDYESVFEDNQRQLDDLKAQINSLKAQLAAEQTDITAAEGSLSAENSRLQQLLTGGRTDEYNGGVSTYNTQVEALKVRIGNFNALANQINSLVKRYNSLAVTQQSLVNSIDTRLAPLN